MSGLETRVCLCRQLNLTAPGPPRPVIDWRCSSPQAWHGFCGGCGRQLFWDCPGENIAIFAGSLDGDTGTALAGNMFCADKGDYYQINGSLIQAEAVDPALTTPFYT